LGDIFKVKLTIFYIQFLESSAGETIFKKAVSTSKYQKSSSRPRPTRCWIYCFILL